MNRLYTVVRRKLKNMIDSVSFLQMCKISPNPAREGDQGLRVTISGTIVCVAGSLRIFLLRAHSEIPDFWFSFKSLKEALFFEHPIKKCNSLCTDEGRLSGGVQAWTP